MNTFLVVYATKNEDWFEGSERITDHYSHYERFERAKEEYDSLLEMDNLYSASITVVLESTDYDGIDTATVPEDIELCHGCGEEVMYKNSEDFDPVTYGKDDAIFHSDCWEPHHGCVNGCEDICKCEEYNQGED